MGLQYASTECTIYLAEALIGMKSYAMAQSKLENALNNSERLGLQDLLAQSHFFLGRTLEASGHSAGAPDQYRQARQIADSIQKEAHTDTIARRSDLTAIYTHPA